MKTKINYLFILPLALAFSASEANAQHKVSASPTLIQFWDFNNIRPISGLGFKAPAGSQDSLGTAWSYSHSLAMDTTTGVTWPLWANYVAPGLDTGHIVYSRPMIHYSSTGRDSAIDGVSGGSFIYDYSSSNYSYFTKSDSGFATGNGYLKVRNPSDSCEFIMYIPTTGYKNIQLQYAISQSSTNGAQWNVFSYSTNGGTTWNALTSAMDTFNTGGVMHPDSLSMSDTATVNSRWSPEQINFTSDPTVNNNPLFILKWRMAGITTSTLGSGNDRYDNFAVWGTLVSGIDELPAQAAGYNVYPNPANDEVNITSDKYTGAKVITLFNVLGQSLSVTENQQKQTIINTSDLTSGVYFVEIKEISTGNKYTTKLVKE